jgi:hypothetical protein
MQKSLPNQSSTKLPVLRDKDVADNLLGAVETVQVRIHRIRALDNHLDFNEVANVGKEDKNVAL